MAYQIRNSYNKQHQRTWQNFSRALLRVSLMILGIMFVYILCNPFENLIQIIILSGVSIVCLFLVGLACAIRKWDEDNNTIDRECNYSFVVEMDGGYYPIQTIEELKPFVERVYTSQEDSCCILHISPTIAGFTEILFNQQRIIFSQEVQKFCNRKEKKTIRWHHIGGQHNDMGHIYEDIDCLFHKELFDLGYYTYSLF